MNKRAKLIERGNHALIFANDNVSAFTDAGQPRIAAANRILAGTLSDLIKEVTRLAGVVERLGSSEAFKIPFVIKYNTEGQELQSRIQYAQDHLNSEG